MSLNDYLIPDGLFRQGLQHFNRGEWEGAIDAFAGLQASGNQYPGVAELLADARIKQQIESAEPPLFMAPPRSPKLLRALLTVAVCLVLVAGFQIYLLLPSTPPPTAAVAAALPMAAEPAATPEPTAVPGPTAVPAPAEALVVPGSVDIKPSDETAFVSAPANVEIILDASGSMFAQVPNTGKERWQVAQDALMSLIQSGRVSEQSQVALRTYSRRNGECDDLELAQALQPFRGDALAGVVLGIKPTPNGTTPLAASLRAAAEDLAGAQGETLIILVTDGIESCDGDPVAEAANFVRDNPQRKVHVVGFAIDTPEASETLRQIAVAGSGLYFDSVNAEEVAAAMGQTIQARFQIVAEDGAEVAAGTVGQGPVQLQPGAYKLKINANPPVEQDLVVDNGTSLEVKVRQGYGGLIADVKDVTPEPEGESDL